MMIERFNEMAEAVSTSIDAGNAVIATAVAALVGIFIMIRRYIISNR